MNKYLEKVLVAITTCSSRYRFTVERDKQASRYVTELFEQYEVWFECDYRYDESYV